MSNTSLIITSGIIVTVEVILAIMLIRNLQLGQAKKKLIIGTGIFIAILFIILISTLPGGNLLPHDLSNIGYFVVIMVTVGVYGALVLLTPVRKSFNNLSPEYLLLPQGLRILFGANFLAQGALELMPLGASLVHGSMHVGTGFFSLIAVISYLKGRNSKPMILFANFFGILDILITAFDISFVSFTEMGVADSMNFAVFFAAPVYFWLHVMSINKALVSNPKTLDN